MNRKNWTKGLVFTFAMSIALNLAAATGGRSEEQVKKPTPATKIESPKELTAAAESSGEDYVVVITDKDTTPLSVYQKYLESADFWRQITEHNLLKDGVSVRIPKNMLKSGQIPAKVTKFSGNVEIARNFDWKWVKVVPDMLVQEGDIRIAEVLLAHPEDRALAGRVPEVEVDGSLAPVALEEVLDPEDQVLRLLPVLDRDDHADIARQPLGPDMDRGAVDQGPQVEVLETLAPSHRQHATVHRQRRAVRAFAP